MPKNLYEILEIAEAATQEEIKVAYRRLAMKWHPDRNPDNKREAEERFKEIGFAYKILSDPVQREKYDAKLNQRRQKTSTTSTVEDDRSYEGSAFSAESASQMFFEQIFDLAAELATRGFNEEQIFKALLGLECPEMIARAAAKHAAKSSGTSSSFRAQKPEMQNQKQHGAAWHEVMPYYAAIINGAYPASKMGDVEYSEKMKTFSQQSKAYWFGLSTLFMGAIFAAVLPALLKNGGGFYIYAGVVALLGMVTLLGTAFWRMFSDSETFRRERALRYYLLVFECLHNSKPLPFRLKFNLWAWFCSITWLAYRRMLGKSVLALFFLSLLVLIGKLMELFGTVSLGWVLQASGILFAASIGLFANKLYFRHARSQVEAVSSSPYEAAIAQLSSRGGVNIWAALSIVALSLVIGVPSVAFDEAIEDKNLSEAKRAQHAEMEAQAHERELDIAKEKAAAKAEAEALAWAGKPVLGSTQQYATSEDQQFQLILRDLESRHPELNPDSPRYNQNIVNEVMKRAEYYQSLGYVRNDAIQLAVSSLERESTGSAGSSGAAH